MNTKVDWFLKKKNRALGIIWNLWWLIGWTDFLKKKKQALHHFKHWFEGWLLTNKVNRFFKKKRGVLASLQTLDWGMTNRWTDFLRKNGHSASFQTFDWRIKYSITTSFLFSFYIIYLIGWFKHKRFDCKKYFVLAQWPFLLIFCNFHQEDLHNYRINKKQKLLAKSSTIVV